MTCELDPVSPPAGLYRLARRPQPWSWPDWAHAEADGTFGNRYDDPEGEFRVLYAATQRLATFVETLAYYRADPMVAAGLAEIEGDADGPGPGYVPKSWITERAVGEAIVDGDFAAVGRASSLAYLRRAMASRLLHHGIDDLDAAAIRQHAPRRFTQEVSRHVYKCSEEGRRRFAGDPVPLAVRRRVRELGDLRTRPDRSE